MVNGKKIIVVLPAYNAKDTLEKTYSEIPFDIVDDVILVDDHSPDNTFEVLIDNKSVRSGKLEDEFDFLPPKEIKDPKASKPDDWVNDAKMPDPTDIKPEGYDSILAEIPDPDASKPDDWDDDDDGEWEAPMIDNPDYKGPWKPKMVRLLK